MIRYSPKSARAIGYLKQFYNDIEIYVEDTASPNTHLLICRRILGPEARLTSVTPLGSKEQVIAACRLDQIEPKRKRLYVIDGDFDLILRRPKPRLRHLYRLRAYCIENLILSETAIEAVCLQISPLSQPPKVHALLDLRAWLTTLANNLRPLFISYAICNEIDPTIQTVGATVYSMCISEAKEPKLETTKVFRRIRAMLRNCRATSSSTDIREVRSRVEEVLSGDIRDLKYVSGKDYILPLLYHRLRNLFELPIRVEQLKVQLAAQYEPSQEPFYARRLRREAGI
ncbi:DUF4435 domain-containing protein [Bradyrhizobium oligotrophicum]|uniref:DUF4435 domain-containing protein n=1 Tax=Bradyrhizobium oligotrophicum TaxID=44255 RepID=UPI003EB8A22B